jgi:DNA-binding Lrp family transcriptional regulator
VGAVLKHREVGYAANALCAWNVPVACMEEVAAVVTLCPEISHCYARRAYPQWQYNFYTMLHGYTREECQALAARLADKICVTDYIMLFSTREWKKTSMRYFGS